MVSNELETRLERAQSLDADVFVQHDSPHVLELDSESGETYTIVPNTAYCSCPDATYRQQPCKHLLYVLTTSDQTPSAVREALVTAIHDEAESYTTEAEELVSRATQAREKATVWTDVLRVLAESAGVEIDDADVEPDAGETTTSLGDEMASNAGSPGPLPQNLARVVDSATVE